MNSHIAKNKFDNSAFVLRFPSIDYITGDIVLCTEECVLFKIDVACALCNLRVNPVDSLKLGIHWKGQFHVNLAVAFGWTHSSTAFQILSVSIAFIVAKTWIKRHCFIDDYTAGVPKAKVQEKFQFVCELLHELRLPLNCEN